MSQINKLSNFQQRVLIGLPGAFLIIWGICVSQWFYFGIFFLICSLSIIEFYNLLRQNQYHPQPIIGTFTGVFLFILTFLVETQILDSSLYFLMFPLVALIFFIVLYKIKENNRPFINIGLTLLGIIYVALPIALINFCVINDGEYYYEVVLGILLLLWASDTGAYFSGKSIGKHKLFERISPKKTWEGTIGGALLSLAFAIGMAQFFDVLSLWKWITLSLIIVIAGTYGDLIESLFKRSFEIKDSGKLLLGHGGFLDRFDGLFFAAPFIVAFLRIFL
ncbi:MAG TPA: phosphatidate cytidylyltransferase [Cytophagales bacterium]|nr:phosphatidate cytidylyltransferase [Cytophagales bacterium]